MNQEIYVLCSDRSSSFAVRFLNEFLHTREPSAGEYAFPQVSDEPVQVFQDAFELFALLEANPREPYAFYWNNRLSTASIHQAMLFYTKDDHLILGLAVDPALQAVEMTRLKQFAGTDVGYFGWEQPPPETAAEFISIVASSARSSA